MAGPLIARFDPLQAQKIKNFPRDVVDRTTRDGAGLGVKLSDGGKRLYGFLYTMAVTMDRKRFPWPGYVFPGLALLADRLGMSEREVRRCRAELVKAGVLEVQRHNRTAPNRYFFLWHPAFDRTGLSAHDRTGLSAPPLEGSLEYAWNLWKKSHPLDRTNQDIRPDQPDQLDRTDSYSRPDQSGQCI